MICASVFDDMVATLVLESKAITNSDWPEKSSHHGCLDLPKEPKASWIRPASVSTSFVKLDVDRPIRKILLRASSGLVLVVPGNRFDKSPMSTSVIVVIKSFKGSLKNCRNSLINVDIPTNFK